jgi:hypothetical protein
MRKALIKTLELYRKANLLGLKLRGLTPDDAAARAVVSGAAWEEFCDTLKAAGAALQHGKAPLDPVSQAEGYRYLTRLLRAGLEAFVEHADPLAPSFRHVVHETIKMGSDNPDNRYLHASVDGRLEYRIRGQRGSVAYLGFGTQIGHYGQSGGMPPTGYLEGSQLVLEPDGRFEILVSATPRPGNWLPMSEQTGTLIVRQTFLDREHETAADLQIERLGGDAAPSPFTAARLQEGLRSASTLVAGASMLFARWADEWQAHANRLPRFDQARSNAAGGDPNIAYYHSYFRLTPDEALVIDALPPRCEYWNFQLNDYWLESLDYRHARIHLNKHSARYRPDGSVRVVVAARDPGVDNWLSTTGHGEGTMTWRWVRAEAHPEPTTRVVPLSAVGTLDDGR